MPTTDPAAWAGRSRGGRAPAALKLVTGLLAVVLLAAGCQSAGSDPGPSPTPSPTPRPFTVVSTDRIRVTDPAAITDAASTILSLSVFQRLMTADPGQDVLKPDAARDCLFTAATTYTCTLNKSLSFSNGHPLTSSDVKFSIERAARLNVPGSSAALLSSLRRIETPDDLTVRFLLSRPDTQFGWALASPAASIVDEEVYDADEVRDAKDDIVGSGPFAVHRFNGSSLELTRFGGYIGRTPARLDNLVFRSVPDSASIEDAMTRHEVDVVWRGLDAAAVTRLSQQVQESPDRLTSSGYSQTVLSGARVLQLIWSPGSRMRSNKGLRQAISTALQGDRTSDTLVPNGVPGHSPSFPQGGKATPKVTWKSRIKLTLGYDPTAPNAQDTATQIRTRLENTGGLSVQLRSGDAQADLALVDRKAWTATALAWLQPYLDNPLPASVSTVESLDVAFRRTTDDQEVQRLLAALQRQAASDQVVLPFSQSDERLYVRAGCDVGPVSYGPGWQLGLFGVGYA